MGSNIVSLLGARIERSGDSEIGGGIFSLSKGVSKRIRFLLDLAEIQNPESNEKKKSPPYIPIVRGRTIKRTMKAIDRRCQKLQERIQELRKDPEKYKLVVEIFVSLVLLKVELKEPGTPIPEERMNRILDAKPTHGYEIDTIIEILMNFNFTRKEVFETIRGDTAMMIRAISYDDVYTFLKNLPKIKL